MEAKQTNYVCLNLFAARPSQMHIQKLNFSVCLSICLSDEAWKKEHKSLAYLSAGISVLVAHITKATQTIKCNVTYPNICYSVSQILCVSVCVCVCVCVYVCVCVCERGGGVFYGLIIFCRQISSDFFIFLSQTYFHSCICLSD